MSKPPKPKYRTTNWSPTTSPCASAAPSVCTQYRESDLAFVQRLLAEEGLYAWFEHASGASTVEARHTLVIADHMDALAD